MNIRQDGFFLGLNICSLNDNANSQKRRRQARSCELYSVVVLHDRRRVFWFDFAEPLAGIRCNITLYFVLRKRVKTRVRLRDRESIANLQLDDTVPRVMPFYAGASRQYDKNDKKDATITRSSKRLIAYHAEKYENSSTRVWSREHCPHEPLHI